MELKITDHAYERAIKRLGWNDSALSRLANKAFTDGIKHSDTKGKLNRYITKLWFKYRTANNIRIHGEIIYLFCDYSLITLYQIPNELKGYIKS